MKWIAPLVATLGVLAAGCSGGGRKSASGFRLPDGDPELGRPCLAVPGAPGFPAAAW